MTFDQTPSSDPRWQQPPPPGVDQPADYLPAGPAPEAPSRRRRAAWIGAIALVVVLGAAGIAFAAWPSSATRPSAALPATSPTTTAPNRGPGGHLGRFGGSSTVPGGVMGLGLALGGNVVHAQYTVSTGKGTYKTIDVQVGKTSAISSTSITVTSADGYAHTYVVTSSTLVDAQRDGIGSVASGNQVSLTATNANGTQTATNIVDTTQVGAAKQTGGGIGFGFGGGPPKGPPSFPVSPPSSVPATAS